MKKRRILCLDVGEKRIGIAISDPDGRVAFPLDVLNRTSSEKDLGTISDLIDENQVSKLVIGHPISLSGGKSHQTLFVEEFTEELKKVIDVETILWDERLSTSEADKSLRSMGTKSRKRKDKIDAIAASLILQNYLDNCRTK